MKATSQPASLSSLTNFDALPDTANVRQPVVEALFACSSATVWRWVKAGIIPSPRKLSSRVTVWNVGQLRAALAGNGGA
jgi:predicted DNA-binding transcriptional regulator AlpA